MSNNCLQTYSLVQHDAVVPDPIFIARGERMDVNVLIDANKEGTSISLVQIHLNLSVPHLHKSSISILSCSR